MNCKEIKYFLLGCENADRPPADIKAHLKNCPDCRDWENRLALIEMNVPFLPVPESAARAELLQKILSPGLVKGASAADVLGEEPVVIPKVVLSNEPKGPVAPIASDSSRPSILRFFRSMEPSARRFAIGSAAAAILLVILGWSILRTPHRPADTVAHYPPGPADPLLASILQRDLRLAEAKTASERFLVLADLADDLSEEVKTLAPLPEAKVVLDDLVQRYQEVVRTGLLEVAMKLPFENRDDLLNKVGERLRVAGHTILPNFFCQGGPLDSQSVHLHQCCFQGRAPSHVIPI